MLLLLPFETVQFNIYVYSTFILISEVNLQKDEICFESYLTCKCSCNYFSKQHIFAGKSLALSVVNFMLESMHIIYTCIQLHMLSAQLITFPHTHTRVFIYKEFIVICMLEHCLFLLLYLRKSNKHAFVCQLAFLIFRTCHIIPPALTVRPPQLAVCMLRVAPQSKSFNCRLLVIVVGVRSCR